MAGNWVTKIIKRITQRKVMEQWETKRGNFKVIPQALWPTAKPLFKWDR
jgi:hypothetical protein